MMPSLDDVYVSWGVPSIYGGAEDEPKAKLERFESRESFQRWRWSNGTIG